MANVHAFKNGWATPIENNRLIIANNIAGARECMEKGNADVFCWEKFTTKPHVDSGEWQRIGEIVTPWPCFVVVASEKAMMEKGETDTKTQTRCSYVTRRQDPLSDHCFIVIWMGHSFRPVRFALINLGV